MTGRGGFGTVAVVVVVSEEEKRKRPLVVSGNNRLASNRLFAFITWLFLPPSCRRVVVFRFRFFSSSFCEE